VSKNFKYLKLFFLLLTPFLSLFFLDYGKEDVNAIICASGYYCSNNNVNFSPSERGTTGSNGTCRWLSGYSCNGQNNNCREDYVNTWSGFNCDGTRLRINHGCCQRETTPPPPSCNDCTPTCPSGTATSPNTGYSTTASCYRGDGCSPSHNYLTCYYQRQNYCSSATTSKRYLKSGESATITSTSNTPVNQFAYNFYNRDNGNAIVCSTLYIAGWATNQGTCPSGSYQLVRVNTYATTRTTDTTTFPANTIFVNDANWGGQRVKSLQINAYYALNDRPWSLPEVPCVFYQDHCTPLCTPTACVGPTYTSTPTGYGTQVYTCSNSPSQCGSESRTCYCANPCVPSCTPTYSDTNYGFGSVTLACNNACGVTGTRTCYVDRCSNCTPPSCPSPLTATSPGNPNMILSNFTSCTRTSPCGGPPNYRSCYEPISPQPTTSLQVHPDAENTYGFSSSTHSGTRTTLYNLNDPIRMTATYTDVNGATDIEAVSVWFRENTLTGEVATPLWIDTATNPSQPPQAPSANSWGFMMRWESSAWRPYVPSYTGATAKWVRAVFSSNSFVISGPGGLQMVRVTIGHNLQASITRSGNNVVMPFQLSFNFASGYENVAQVTYNTFLMGNDIFSFTPYDNYTAYPDINSKIGDYWSPGQLRYRTTPTVAQLYARQWATTGYPWTIDKGLPEVGTLNMTVIGDTNLRLSWTVADTKEIYAIVGNIYASITMPPNPPAITMTGTGLEINSPFNLITDDTNLGKLNTGYAFRKLNVGGTTYSGSVDINIGENKEGSLIVYLTVFDKAGNMHIRSLTFSLGDWIITHGGLAYSSNGRDYEMKVIGSPTAWNAVPVLAGMNPLHADVSTEVFGDNVGGTNPSALNTSVLLKSFHMRPFSMNTNIKSLYEELRKAYNDREIEGKVDMTKALPQVTSLNGSLRNIGGCNLSSSVCILKHSGDFQVGNISNFVCDGWGVFFIDGDLTIHREIRTSNANKDACIFVVSGNVNIKEGAKASTAGQLQYDQVRSYILADGHITIDPELGLSPKYDGLFVEGGLHSLGGLQMNRSLKLVDRNIYPALVVKYHSKYSVLSNLVFGSQVDILKTELGFKPY